MNSRQRRHAAWRQAAILATGLAGVAVGLFFAAQRPARQDDLKIPIGELRSQGFELQLLNDDVGRGRARRFAQAHAHQLARSIERSRDELASLQPIASLVAARAEGLQHAKPLADAAAQLRDGRAPLAGETAATLAETGRRLQSLEDGLKR